MGTEYTVGQKVKLLKDIFDDGADHHPPSYLARKGEVLIVRSIRPRTFPVYISHEHITDNSFGVALGEIEPT